MINFRDISQKTHALFQKYCIYYCRKELQWNNLQEVSLKKQVSNQNIVHTIVVIVVEDFRMIASQNPKFHTKN